jgi:hypothetical protein
MVDLFIIPRNRDTRLTRANPPKGSSQTSRKLLPLLSPIEEALKGELSINSGELMHNPTAKRPSTPNRSLRGFSLFNGENSANDVTTRVVRA